MEQILFGLIKKRGEMAGQHKVALKAIAVPGKYKQIFGGNEWKLTIVNALRVAPSSGETIAAKIIATKGWNASTHADLLKRVRDALQRAQKDRHVVQEFGPDGCVLRLAP